MKFPHLLAALSLGALLPACNSLDNPLSNFSNLGHDGRVYNSTTGHYEWPDDSDQRKKEKQQQQRTAAMAATMKATPTPAAAQKGDGRYYDPAKGNFVVADDTHPATRKPKPTPIPAVARVTPEPAPEKGTGVYNMETGKFDWAPSGMPSTKKPNPPASPETPATPAPAVPSGTGAPLFPQ